MVRYTITTRKYMQMILKSLHEEKACKKYMGKNFKVEEKEGVYYFEVKVSSRDDEVLSSFANMLMDIIQTEVLIEYTRKYINKNDYLDEAEKKEISDMFILNNYVSAEEGVSYVSYYLLYAPILRFIKENNKIDIDGWITFRTSQYKVILRDMIEQAIYDYETQKDYLRFIYLLRENRKLQESIESEIHLIPFNGVLDIFNKSGKRVTEQYIKLYSMELIEEEGMTQEDLVMNTLITISPEKIYIHKKDTCENAALIDTIEKIFEGYVYYCEECPLCKKK